MDAPAPSDPVQPPARAWTEPAQEVPWSAAPANRRAPHRLPGRRSASWAGFLGWLVPGLGQVYLGRYGAGLLLLLVIGGTFAGGLALTDFTCVDPHRYPLEFVAHVLIGGPMMLALKLTGGLHLDRLPPWIEVGHLYAVVAGFLNLVAVCDALGECWRRNARIQGLRARLAVRDARAAFEREPATLEPQAVESPAVVSPAEASPAVDAPADVPSPSAPPTASLS